MSSMPSSTIIVQQLTFEYFSNILFEQINFTLNAKIAALVGPNGSGKTTLAKLILGTLKPTSGFINAVANIGYLSQEENFAQGDTVAEYLGVAGVIGAIQALEQGNYCPSKLTIINDRWTLEQDTQDSLANLGFRKNILSRKMVSLSGGERTLIRLHKLVLSAAKYLILDEPTNHLDVYQKEKFIQWMHQTSKSLLIISHDRVVLEQVEQILSIENKKIVQYGGNYTFYQKEKAKQAQAKQQAVKAQSTLLNQSKKQLQQSKQKHDQRSKIGVNRKKEEIKARGYASRASYDFFQNRAEKNLKKINMQFERKQSQLKSRIETLEADIEQLEQIDIKITPVKVPNNKIMLNVVNLCHAIDSNVLFENVSFVLRGPARLHIKGGNGSGKTILMKLLAGLLTPQSGQIDRSSQTIQYLDQSCHLLLPNKTVIENYLYLNPSVLPQLAFNQLASFLFKDKFHIKVKNLSGGEKMRLSLASILFSRCPTDLLLLDEPTNHMDLESIECIEQILNQYTGTLVVVSHDERFVRNISLGQEIKIGNN